MSFLLLMFLLMPFKASTIHRRPCQCPLEDDGVCARGEVLETFLYDGLSEHYGGGGAVARDVVGLGGNLLYELGARVLKGSSSSISSAMVTPSLVIKGVPNFYPKRRSCPLVERDLDSVSQRVYACKQNFLASSPYFNCLAILSLLEIYFVK